MSSKNVYAKNYNVKKIAVVEEPKLMLDLSKFSTSEKPKKTKARFRNNVIEAYQINVRGRDASVSEANSYIDATMRKLFAANGKTEKLYKVLYKLSDGRYYETKNITDINSSFYPDLKDEQYGIDHSNDLVEHINIMVVDRVQKK